MKSRDEILDMLLAIIACLLWSTAFVGVKFCLQYEWSPFVLAGVRFIIASLMLLPLCGGYRSLKDTLTKHTRAVVSLSFFQTVLLYGSFFMAMQYVKGAVAAIVIGSSPLVSAVVAHIMMQNDKFTRKNLVAIGFGTVGIVVISLSTKPWDPVGIKEFIGVLVLLFGAVVSAIGNVIVAKKKGAVHPVALNSMQMLGGGVVLLVVGLAANGVPPVTRDVRFYIAMIWLAFLSATAFSIWFKLLSRHKVSRLNVWKFLIPVFGAITSWMLIADEEPELWSVLGMLLVGGGVILANLPGGEEKSA